MYMRSLGVFVLALLALSAPLRAEEIHPVTYAGFADFQAHV
jgi:hypothetical protein